VAQVDRAVVETALVQELQIQTNARERRLAAADQGRRQEQVDLVHQARPHRLGGEPGPPIARSRSASSFIRRTASGSKARSIRVRSLRGASRVVE
jgi:hypothetical protein